MPTVFEKDWFTKANIDLGLQPEDRNRNACYELKRLLTGESGASQGLWTVVGSCDGLVFGMDGVDRWGAAGNVLVPNSAAAARSWIALQGPGVNPYYVTIECSFSSAFNGATSIAVYRSSPNGGSLTGPPVADDPVIAALRNSSTSSAFSTTPGKYSGCYGLADDGSFFWLANRELLGRFSAGFIFSVLAESVPGDVAPSFGYRSYGWSAQNDEAILSDIAAAATSNAGSITPKCFARRFDNVASADISLASLAETGRSGTAYIPANYTEDAALGAGIRPDTHIYVYQRNPGLTSLRGRVQDIRWAPNLPHGTVEPDTDNPVSMAVGYLWFPMSEVPDMS